MKLKLILIIYVLLLLSGCADSMSFDQAALTEKVGFMHGLWHGLIIVFSLFGSLFSDDIAIYAIYNNGIWYDIGFVFGVGGFGLGTGFLR